MPTVYLIRHAHAGDRRGWEGDDRSRPLSEKGNRQATNLARALADAGVERVLASPATRCVQTVEPLAASAGVPVEEHRDLLEGADPTRVIRLIEGAGHGTIALCGHGDVIPEVIQLLRRRGMHLDGPAGNNKGSWWEIEHVDGEFPAARWHPPA